MCISKKAIQLHQTALNDDEPFASADVTGCCQLATNHVLVACLGHAGRSFKQFMLDKGTAHFAASAFIIRVMMLPLQLVFILAFFQRSPPIDLLSGYCSTLHIMYYFTSGLWLAGMGGRVPTWRMVPGSSTESLALDVALQCKVPPEIVQRAAHLFKVSNMLHTSQVAYTVLRHIVRGQL